TLNTLLYLLYYFLTQAFLRLVCLNGKTSLNEMSFPQSFVQDLYLSQRQSSRQLTYNFETLLVNTLCFVQSEVVLPVDEEVIPLSHLKKESPSPLLGLSQVFHLLMHL